MLNYIQEGESYCRICLIEMGKLEAPKEEYEDFDICPECGENLIKQGEIMCHQCALLEQAKIEVKDPVDEFAEPVEPVAEVEEEDMFVSLEEIEEYEEDDEEEEVV